MGCPCKIYNRMIPPEGSKNPEIYIVGEAPGKLENIEGVPFIGESGQLLRTAMRIVNKAIGRKFRYRINNSCLCSPKDKEGNIRTPTFAESMNCSRIHLYSDIAKHPPSKGIITLGKLAISAILGENIKSMKQCIGSVYEFHGIKVYPFYHPSYIKRNGGTSSLLFKKLIDHIEEVLTGKKQITKISTEVKLNYEYIVVKDEEVDKIFEEEILNKKYICLDIETNGLAYKLNHIKTRCIGIAVDKRKAYVFLPSEKVNKNLDKLFRSETKILGQNIGFDIGFLCYKNGYKWPKILTDTMLAGYLLNENQRRYNLLELYRRYLPEFAEYKKKAEGNVLHMNDKQLYEYNAADCIGELRLAEKLYKKLRREKLLWLHDNIMIPALKVIHRKEQRGVRFDVPYMKKLDAFLAKKQRVIERNIRSQPDFIEFRKHYKTVKLTSPIDIRNFFIEFKKYPVVSTSKKTKFPAMDVKTLEYYADNLDCKIAKLLLKLRKIQKARSTYLSGLIPKLIGDIGYPTYNLTRTATGRLSSGGRTKGIDTNKAKIKLFQDDIAISDFNIQNIPSRDKTLKNIVIAREGRVLIAADYDTSEIKCAAAYSKCPAMREFCNDKKKDFHTLVASEVFKVPYNEVSKELRTIAKSISFGVLYGMTKEGLALRLGISVDEAERYINEYFERMPEVKEAIDRAIDNVRKYGYVVNPFGRRRRFEYLNAEVEREAFNAIIQSFSSDLLLFALIKLDSLCEREDPETEPIYPLIDVHDSIVVEAYDHPATIEEAIEMITYSMVKYPLENRVVRKALWGVRPSIDIKIGYKWGDMIDYKEFMQKYC